MGDRGTDKPHAWGTGNKLFCTFSHRGTELTEQEPNPQNPVNPVKKNQVGKALNSNPVEFDGVTADPGTHFASFVMGLARSRLRFGVGKCPGPAAC